MTEGSMTDDGVTELLSNVVNQLQIVHENVQSCQETSMTLDSGVETSDKLGRVESDVALLIREIRLLQSGKSEPKVMTGMDNSMLENISLALSSLELAGSVSPLSEDDSLERMVDQLFRNVRSLKSMLGDPPPDQGGEEAAGSSSDDSSEQLSRLIEQLSNSVSVSAALRSSRQTSGESREGGRWQVTGRRTFDSHGPQEEGSVVFDSSTSSSELTEERSSSEFGETGSEARGDDEEEDTTDLLSVTDSSTEATDDCSTTLEYGFIPVNYTIVGSISQCATPDSSRGRAGYDPRRATRPLHRAGCGAPGGLYNTYSDDDSLNLEELPSEGGLLPEFPVPLHRGGKDVLDMFNQIQTDMDSLHKMVDYAGTSSEGDLAFTLPKLLSGSSDLPSSTKSRDALLSGIVNRAAAVLKDLEDERKGSPLTGLISQSLSSDKTEAEDIDRQFLELMDTVQRVNQELGKARSPGEIVEGGEWDSFTPLIDTPPARTRAVPLHPSSEAADDEVRMITEEYPTSTTTSHQSPPEEWQLVSTKTHPTHTTEEEVLVSEPISVRSAATHTVNVATGPTEDPAREPDIPNFLRLFVKPGERIDDFVPNTPLLNAILAHSGLTIKPLVEKVNASLNTSFKDEISDDTSKMISLVEDLPKTTSSSLPSSSKSKPVQISIGSRPPKLESLVEPVSEKSTSSQRTLSDAMGIPRDSSVSERASSREKPKILLNRKSAEEKKKSPPKKAPDIYNVPPPPVLTMDTWTNTDTESKTVEVGVETNTVQRVDRAVSPILTMDTGAPKKKKRKSKSPKQKTPPPKELLPPPVVVVEEVPMEETVPHPPPVKPTPTRAMQDDEGYLYGGNEVPEISEGRDPGQFQGVERSPSMEDSTISDRSSLPSVKEEEPAPVPAVEPTERVPKPPKVTEPEVEESEGESSTSSEDEEDEEGRKVAPENLQAEIDRAVREILARNRPVNPDTIRGLKEQLKQQNEELGRRRAVLASSRDRVRDLAQMFDMNKSGTNTPLDDIM